MSTVYGTWLAGMRSPAQQAQDEEDERLLMCGMLEEPERLADELQEFASRHYDFVICGLSDGPLRARRLGGAGPAPAASCTAT